MGVFVGGIGVGVCVGGMGVAVAVDGSVGKSGVGVSVAARHALNNRLTNNKHANQKKAG
jgi:hypothetical protein